MRGRPCRQYPNDAIVPGGTKGHESLMSAEPETTSAGVKMPVLSVR